ncbi:MAG TPA: ParB/RepB/Spo0J family partition protein [Kofleriaceae bacterium]|nr:ParB/RepB/Spo0J family partition protein [Kofleriaceae bacterium]
MSIDPKKKGLGRGLSALLPTGPAAPRQGVTPSAPQAAPGTLAGIVPPMVTTATPAAPRTYFFAGIELLFPSPEQPRRIFGETELEELAASIRIHGVIMPLVVRPRPSEGGGYFLIAGERRWRAAQRAGLHEVPVVVQNVAPQAAFERALVENLQRADLGPLEEAAAYQRLMDEFSLTQDAVAQRVGKDRSTVANAIRLLRLPATVRQWVEDKKLSMGHARALLALDDDAAIERAARTVIAKGLSVRATEALAKPAASKGAPTPATKPSGKTPAIRDLEQRLTSALGGPVNITEDAPGKAGRIEIRYQDLDHLDRLLDRLL